MNIHRPHDEEITNQPIKWHILTYRRGEDDSKQASQRKKSKSVSPTDLLRFSHWHNQHQRTEEGPEERKK